MMKRPARVPVKLSQSLQHRLNAYALMASAAGVSALALSQAAQAKIVYTPAHVVLRGRSNSHYYIDLNHDGVTDFVFSHAYNYSSTTGFLFSMVQVSPYKSDGNAVMGAGYPMALRKGAKIGSGRFSHYGIMAVARATGRSGPRTYQGSWANDGKGRKDRYVGLYFVIKGKAHFGWARVSVSKYHFVATLTGYAYETIANKAILAGSTHGTEEGAGLGKLAAGTAATAGRQK